MRYPWCHKATFPLARYAVNSYRFGERCWYDSAYWGVHLGDDIIRPAGTSVRAIGDGRIVYSALHPGNRRRRNWGGIVIIGHRLPKPKKSFFSVYGHLDKRRVSKGMTVERGQIIGKIAKAETRENGRWPESHLHFALYTGRWNGRVLPGYWKAGQGRTRRRDWHAPSQFLGSLARTHDRNAVE